MSMVLVCLPSDALLTTPTVLLGFLLPRTWGISSGLLQESTPATPYLGHGVSSHCRPSWPWTWSSSSQPSCPQEQPLLGGGEAPLGCPPPQRCRSLALSVATPDLGRGVAPHSLVSLIFLMKSLVFPILLFSSLSLQSSFRKLSYLSLLFFRTLDSEGYIFSFLLCLSLPFFSQLFVRPPQTTSLPFCISFSWGCFWSLPPVQCYKLPSVVLQALYQI